MSDLKSFYVPVRIEGIALVYAKGEEEARVEIECTTPMVAGNKMRRHEIEIVGEIECLD